jgi:hypothetical protein
MTRTRLMAFVFTNRPAHWVAFGLLVLFLGTLSAVTQSQEVQPASKPAAPVDTKLQLIGSLASSHVYTTFGYIGVVADNVQKDLYTPDDVDRLMKEITVISDPLIVQLVALQKSEMTPEDAKAVQEIIEIYALLKQESEALRTYAKDKTEANGSEFNRRRAEAWTRVAKLLDIPVKAPAK